MTHKTLDICEGQETESSQPSERVVFALVIGCNLQSTDTGLESLLMTTKKPKKPEKVATIVGQMKGVPSSTSEQLFPPALLKDIKQLIDSARARAGCGRELRDGQTLLVDRREDPQGHSRVRASCLR